MQTKTTIELKDLTTKAFADKNLVQQKAKKKFYTLLDGHLKLLDKSEKELNSSRVHNTILINGKRGYGKSSFMLSLMQMLKKDIKYSSQIHIFDIIDPTIIETKENIFILVLSQIVQLTQDCLRQIDYTDEEYKDIQKSLREVALGINVLDGVGEENQFHQNLWSEPEQILEQGLKNVKGGARLEDSFKKYISKVLRLLDRKAFMVVFDDIDTATNQGKMILELIRKYFTSPKLLVVMLGDIELYNLIVRDLQWKKMYPEATMKFDSNAVKDLYLDEIDTLVNQYMLKIVKSENKIDLSTLYALKDNTFIDEIKLDDYMKQLVQKIFLENEKKSIFFEEFLLDQPIRTITSLFKSFDSIGEDDEIDLFLSDLEYVFVSQLSYSYSYEQLLKVLDSFRARKTNRFYLLFKYFIFLQEQGIDRSIDFIPNNQTKDTNTLNTLLSSHMAHGVKNTQDIFDSFVKFYMPYCFSLSYDFDAHAFKVSRYLVKDVREDNPQKDIYKGTLHLSSDIYELLQLTPKQHSVLNILAVGLFQPKGLHNYLSFWNIFGFISDTFDTPNYNKLLQIKSFSLGDGEGEQDIRKNTLQEAQYDTSTFEKLFSSERVECTLSARQLASIWTRIEYSVKYIDDNKDINFGRQLHRYVIATLNAFIIVVMENVEGINYNNALEFGTTGYNKVFESNMNVLAKQKESYRWLYDLVCLDVWKLFIDLKSEIYNDIEDEIKEHNIFDQLEKIEIEKRQQKNSKKIVIHETLKSLMENMGRETKQRYEALRSHSGLLTQRDYQLSRNAISSKLNRDKYPQKIKDKILSELEKLKEQNEVFK